MELSVRAYNSLKRWGIHTTNDIKGLTYEELCNVHNLGMKCVDEVMAKLNELGISLKEETVKEETQIDRYIEGKINASAITIHDMDFSVRAINGLARSEFQTLEDLLNASEEELMGLKKIGQVTLKEIEDKLQKIKLSKEEVEAEKKKIERGITLEKMDLGVREYNSLKRAGINNSNDIKSLSYEELRDIRNVGTRAANRIISRLKELGVEFKEEIEEVDKSVTKESEEKIMDNVNENKDNVVEEIDPEEYLQEWKESGEESYYKYLFNKYNTEKANGNEELAAHIYKVYTEAHELEQQWMGTADEEKMMDIESEKKKQREDLEREDSINSYPEEPEEVKSGVETEEKIDLGDKTIEELEAIIAENEGTIAGNDKEIKERLIQKILGQQQTIAKQQEEIDRLKSQKVIK